MYYVNFLGPNPEFMREKPSPCPVYVVKLRPPVKLIQERFYSSFEKFGEYACSSLGCDAMLSP